MPDNLQKKRPEDANRINLSQRHEIDYWCNKWSCTEDELRQAVKKAGTDNVEIVRNYL